jgi:ComF family protein
MAISTGKEYLSRVIDVILPPRCVITGETVDEQGMISPKAWGRLSFITDPICSSCGVPLGYEVEQGTNCAECIGNPPAFSSARSALLYDDLSRDMILRFKHADQLHLVHTFIPWLQRAGVETIIDADFMIPVPLHKYRLLRRRYNQSAIITKSLAEATDVKCLMDALVRKRSTPSQGHMKYIERQKNVRNAFNVNPEHALKMKGKTVLLVDDVYTTGATVKECSNVLLKSGVAKVHVLTLARVARNNY